MIDGLTTKHHRGYRRADVAGWFENSIKGAGSHIHHEHSGEYG
jgi:hypothetical protein